MNELKFEKDSLLFDIDGPLGRQLSSRIILNPVRYTISQRLPSKLLLFKDIKKILIGLTLASKKKQKLMSNSTIQLITTSCNPIISGTRVVDSRLLDRIKRCTNVVSLSREHDTYALYFSFKGM